MITIQMTGGYQRCIHFDKDILVYYYHHCPPVRDILFDALLNPLLWRDHLKPFSCVILNQISRETILVRDHLGMEPLYYYHANGSKLIVGQTIPDILNHLPKKPSFVEHQLMQVFSDQQYSDETLYQNIYRVEPGHMMHFKSNGSVIKKAFWQLQPFGPTLHYHDSRDYFAHFSMLMKEAVQHATDGYSNIAAEFSAGLDSSAVYCAAHQNNLSPKLYMHVAPPDSVSNNQYDDTFEKAFMTHYQLNDIQRIGSEGFDFLAVLKEYAGWFAGPAPGLFPMFSNVLHRAVKAGGHPVLLSGFGGDQCVSNQLSLNFFLPELIHQGQYREAWHEIHKLHWIKRPLVYAKHMHPSLYALALHLKIMTRHLSRVYLSTTNHRSTTLHPYERLYYASVREREWSLLQGPESHEVRMRIEYSSIVSKQMGFEYRYPLLYPKLLEFMLSLPTIQKRQDGRGRYLIREYLAQSLSKNVFGTYRKQYGLGLIPSTYGLFQHLYEQGHFKHVLNELPFPQNKNPAIQQIHHIKAAMLRSFIHS